MNTPQELPDLEKTIIEIVLELLLLDREHRHPDLIYSEIKTGQPVRTMMHYVMGLLAYGFGAGDIEMKRAAEWFDTPFPRKRPDYIDADEMNRLLVLLQLRPDKDAVRERLRQLAKQRGGGYFDIMPGWPEFDTLWALKMFVMATRAQVLPEQIMSADDIQQHLDQLLVPGILKRDKDIALALRLQFDMFGTLRPQHEERLQEMITHVEENGGMWGMREFAYRVKNMGWYKGIVEGRKISYADVQDDHEKFRKVIVSTCMVVEYLMPLSKQYSDLSVHLERALTLWWAQFRGQHAVTNLRDLFPKPHDYAYLLVLCRTLRAVRSHAGKPLRDLNNVQLLRELTSMKTNTSESTETRSIKQALRNWIQVDLMGGVEQLRLGFSDANIVRVTPYIQTPLSSYEDQPESLVRNSLIVKYGPAEDIQKERSNYEELPAATLDFFVRIPESSFIDPVSGLGYVVMQDLRDYRTLYEVHEDIAKNVTTFSDQLGIFLCRMHEGGSGQLRRASRSLLRELYLGKMLEHVDRIFNYVWENEFFQDRDLVRSIQYDLFDLIGKLIQKQQELEDFSAAYMHGDLHMRNIMVNGIDRQRRSHGSGLSFKLIDLEFLRRDGDYAFDAGQLIVDIQLVSHEERKLDTHEELTQLRENLEQSYARFAESRNDPTFGIRLDLAKARALLRIGKGKTKRGAKFFHNKQYAQAASIGEEVIAHVVQAQDYLRKVVNAIG